MSHHEAIETKRELNMRTPIVYGLTALISMWAMCGPASAMQTSPPSPEATESVSPSIPGTMREIRSLVLYHRTGCPYCEKVLSALNRLNMQIELRDLQGSVENGKALVAGGGKLQVPCLRIEDTQGHVIWMYESADIVRYLDMLAPTREAQ